MRTKALKVDLRAARLTFNGHRSAIKRQENSIRGMCVGPNDDGGGDGGGGYVHQRHKNYPRDVAKMIVTRNGVIAFNLTTHGKSN